MFSLETFLEKAALELGLVQQTHEGRAMEDGFEEHPAFPVGKVELSGPGNISLPFALRVLADFFLHQYVSASKLSLNNVFEVHPWCSRYQYLIAF